jgi:hypothetical protein
LEKALAALFSFWRPLLFLLGFFIHDEGIILGLVEEIKRGFCVKVELFCVIIFSR